MVTIGEGEAARVEDNRAGDRLVEALLGALTVLGGNRLSTSLGNLGCTSCFALSLDFGRPRFFFGGSCDIARPSCSSSLKMLSSSSEKFKLDK